MPSSLTDWTVETVRALPEDGQRHEVIDGELFVTPSPRLLHQRAVFALAYQFAPYVDRHALGETLTAPADIIFGPRTLVQPDVLVSRLVDGRRPREWKDVRLLLAAEVLSPSTQRTDRAVKRRLFQRERVPDYWIVDLDARLISRWRPDETRPEELDASLEWQPDPSLAPLTIDLPAFFASVLDV